MKIRIDDDYENRRRELEMHQRRKAFERSRHVLVKEQWDEDWRWMFIYPTMEAYERGGEPQRFQFKYITEAEYIDYRELGLFEEVTHPDVLRGRIP